MGTRSTIHFQENKTTIVSIYQQYDGYPECVGLELAQFLLRGKLVNGFGSKDETNFNGMGCLTAQFIATYKKGIGGFYITDKKDRQEYNYFVSKDDLDQLTIKVTDWNNKQIFKGTLPKFKVFCESHK